MANLKVIKKRILSVKNTQKITKAMKMVAAAKLRRAQQTVVASRPYMNKMTEIVTEIVARLPEEKKPGFLKAREQEKHARVFVFTSNRGLCGAFNGGLLRFAEKFLRGFRSEGKTVELIVIGKKGNEFFKARQQKIDRLEEQLANELTFETAQNIAQDCVRAYENHKTDACYFLYNKFASAISQKPTAEKLLPVVLEFSEEIVQDVNFVDYLYEPGRVEILNELLPKYLASKIRMFHKESYASELGARMTAMDNATKNASEMMDGLTLKYNRARQAAITMELLDIVNGAESLKG